MTKQAKPIKLRDGSWGACIQGTVEEGEIVTITTRAGKEWGAQVTRVVWSGERDGKPLSILATRSIESRLGTVTPIRKETADETGELPYCEDEDDIPF